MTLIWVISGQRNEDILIPHQESSYHILLSNYYYKKSFYRGAGGFNVKLDRSMIIIIIINLIPVELGVDSFCFTPSPGDSVNPQLLSTRFNNSNNKYMQMGDRN